MEKSSRTKKEQSDKGSLDLQDRRESYGAEDFVWVLCAQPCGECGWIGTADDDDWLGSMVLLSDDLKVEGIMKLYVE